MPVAVLGVRGPLPVSVQGVRGPLLVSVQGVMPLAVQGVGEIQEVTDLTSLTVPPASYVRVCLAGN